MNEEIYETIMKMPEYMEKALKELNIIGKLPREVKGVAFFGMGGSGIAGKIISECMSEYEFKILAYNDLSIPKNIEKEILIVAVSYSGNTEETLNVAKEAIANDRPLAIISSGGKLIELAKLRSIPYIEIPRIFNQPREALPYLFISTAKILMEIVNEISILNQINDVIIVLYEIMKKIKLDNEPMKIAKKILNKNITIYTYNPLTVSAIRFKQSLNENSKVIARMEVIPEAGHNAIMEFEEDYNLLKNMSTIIIRENEIKNKLIKIMMNTFIELIEKRNIQFEEIIVEGNNNLSKVFSAIYLGDLISVELANLKGIDARKINSIEYLKSNINKYLHT